MARGSDVLLALFTAMLIEPRRLLGLRHQAFLIAVLSVGTLLVLASDTVSLIVTGPPETQAQLVDLFAPIS